MNLKQIFEIFSFKDLIVISIPFIVLFSVGYMVYNNFLEREQKIESYNSWFYSDAKTVYDIDYHVDNLLVPLHDDIYIGQLEVGNELYYLINKKFDNKTIFELVSTQDVMLHKDDSAWLGHEYITYFEQDTKKHIKRIISVPNVEIEKVTLSFDK